ncbi:hypothetical protein WAI453_003233 [Rhynchosporium graminicola]|uniref:AA1-like domain-containing protein n=1 Tax=Rhynchosporium graminicola TaxID=2792576 RepID=A0A1E1LI39_9HELO|nr:uncharacterized protein RCO7_07400 [Rhynchosporium commune]
MQFSTLALSSIFVALAAAAPTATSNETVCIQNLSIRDNEGLQDTSFDLQPANVTCAASAPNLARYKVNLCGDSKYRFAINGNNSEYTVRIYKELGPAYGLYGESDILPVYCHAGGNGINDFICSQVGNAEVLIDNGSLVDAPPS